MKPILIHGTPITPQKLLEQLPGASFCVSFAEPRQIQHCMRLVAEKSVLLLDNGAYTHWQSGKGRIDREEYWSWANAIQKECPQAIAVIPDVIDGDEHENLLECSWAVREGMATFPERVMPIWHTNESQDLLIRYLRLFHYVGIGSSGDFDAVREPKAYLEQLDRVKDVLKGVYVRWHRYPWIHLMRAAQHLGKVPWAHSADSCNLARNHHIYSEVPNHVAQMAQ